MRVNQSYRAYVLGRLERASALRRKATRMLVRHLFVWALSLVVIFSNLAFVFPDMARAADAATEIITDGQTLTFVTAGAGGTDITTSTVYSQTALNSFSKFNIGSGDTVNLHIPENAQNLLNLVHSETSFIDGVLNSYKDSDIGGDVYFLNPHGVIVGESGVVNVGALTVVTPSTEFMTGFFDDPDKSITDTVAGNVSVDRQGNIEVYGRISATDGIRLVAGSVVTAGALAIDITQRPDFDDLVNAGGLDGGSEMRLQNGRIEIVAADSVTHSGSMTTHGFTKVDGGDITIASGGEISMLPTAVVDASSLDPWSSLDGDISVTASRPDGGTARISLDSSYFRGDDISIRAESIIEDDEAVGTAQRSAGAIVDITSDDPDDGLEPWIHAAGDIGISASVDVSMTVSPETESDDSLDAAYAIADIDTTSRVSIDGYSNLLAYGDIDISAENAVEVTSSATASLGDGEGDHIGGSVAVNRLTTTTEAVVGGHADFSASSVSVTATSSNAVTTSAVAPRQGAVEDTAEDPEQQSEMKKHLDEYADDARTSDGAVDVAAALAVNDMTSTTRAALESSEELVVNGRVNVASSATYDSSVTADASTVEAGSTGVGVAVAINKVVSDNRATVDQTVVGAAGVSVTAKMNEDAEGDQAPATMETLAVSGSGSGEVGVAGALAVNVQDTSHVAQINEGASSSEGAIEIASINLSETSTKAGPGEGPDDLETGIGASVAISVAANESSAGVADDKKESYWLSGSGVSIDAEGDHDITTEAQAGSAGDVAVAPAVALTIVDNSTSAGIGRGAVNGDAQDKLAIQGDLAIWASSREIITTSASGSAEGANAAIGSALALAIVDSSTEATLERDVTSGSIDLGASSYRRMDTSSTAGRLGGQEADASTPQDGVDKEIEAQTSLAESKKDELKRDGDGGEGDDGKGDAGKAVPSAETGEGTVSVAAAIGVNLVSVTTRAAVADSANVSTGELTLGSTANTDAFARADGSTVDGDEVGVGVASAVAINKVASVNEAYLGSGLHQVESLTVQAYTRTLITDHFRLDQTNAFSAEAVSGSGATDIGVAGALAVNLTDSRTAALIGEQAVVVIPHRGDVVVLAHDQTVDEARATPHGATTGETAGVGASAAVNVAVRQTLAELSNGADIEMHSSSPIADGDLTVTAISDHSMQTEAIAGARGGVAATAASAVSLSENATAARLGTKQYTGAGPYLLVWGDLVVSADSEESISTLARGSSGGDDVSIGTAAAIALVDSTSEASTERSVRTVGVGGATYSAEGVNRVDTQAIAGELGGQKKDASTPEDGVDKSVEMQTSLADKKGAEAKGETGSDGSDEESGDEESDEKKAAPSAETAEGAVSVAGAVGVNVVSATTRASISDGVQTLAYGNVSLSSAANTDVSVKADGSTVDGSKAGVGVASAVAINTVTSTNEAYLGSGEHSIGGLTLEAKTLEVGNGDSVDKQSEYKAEAVSGAGAEEVGVAGALAINLTDKSTIARIEEGATVSVQEGGLTVSAAERSRDVARSLPAKDGVTGSDAGIGASVALNVALAQTLSEIAAASVSANAGGDMKISSKAQHTMETEVKSGAKGGVAVTAASAVSLSENSVIARLGSAEGIVDAFAVVGGDTEIRADSTETVKTTATGSASGTDVAVGAAVAVALVDASSEAVVESGVSDIRADGGGSVSIAADDAVSVQTTATAGHMGGKAKDESTPEDGVDRKVAEQTALAEKKKEEAKGDEADSSSSDDKATAPSAETAEGAVSVASAVGTNVVTSTARASIADGVNLITTYGSGEGLVKVASAANTDVSVKADGSTADPSKVGVGVATAVALNKVTSTNEAYLGSGDHLVDGLSVEAKTLGVGSGDSVDKQSEYKAEAVSGAGAEDVGVAGALAINLTDSSTAAWIGESASIEADGDDVSVSAQSASKDVAKASPKDGASGSDVGVGASVAVNVALAETVAEIPAATIDVYKGDLSVSAAGRHTAETEAIAGALGGVAVTPAVAVSVIGNTALASIGAGSDVWLALDSSVKATSVGRVTTTAKGQSAGQEVAVGAAVALAFTEDTAEAVLGGELESDGSVTVEASNSTSAETSSEAGAKGGSEEQTGTPENGVDKKVEEQTNLAREKKDEAAREGSTVTTPLDKDAPSAKTDEGTAGVAAAVSVNMVESAARAHTVEGATVGADENLVVRSSSNTDAVVKADGSTVDGSRTGVGVGVAVAINSLAIANEAYLDSGTYAVEGLTIEAKMLDKSSGDDHDTTANSNVEAVSGAGSTNVGVAGSLALNIVDSTTLAQMREGASVDVGGMSAVLTAESQSKDVAKATPQREGASGSVGVGASVAANVLTDITEASIGQDAVLDGASDLTVSASSDHDSETGATAGAAGGVAIDAAAAVSTLAQRTVASIASGSGISVSGTVSLEAVDMGGGKVTATGDTRADNIGVGASVAVLSTDSEIIAIVDRDIAAGGDLNVSASAERAYDSVATAGARGAKDETDSDKKSTSTEKLDETKDKQEGTNDDGKVLVAATVAISEMDDSVRAYVSGGSGSSDRRSIEVDGNISLSAANTSNYSTRADASSASLSTSTGISNAVALSIVENETEAYIGDFSRLSGASAASTGDITIVAASEQNTHEDYVNRLATEALSGSGAKEVGVAGALAVTNTEATTRAHIGSYAVIEGAGDAHIIADNTSKLSAKAWGGAAAEVGIGSSVATIVSRNEYDAHVGDDAEIHVDSLEVRARNNEVSGDVPFEFVDFKSLNLQSLLGQNNYYTEAIAGGAGTEVAVSGAFAVNYFEDVVSASIGSSSVVDSMGIVTIESQYDALAKALAGGVSGAGNTGVGGSHVNVVNNTSIVSSILDHASVGAGSVNVSAGSSMGVGSLGVSAAGADEVGVAGVTSLVVSENRVEASIGDNASVHARVSPVGGEGEGDLIVEATNDYSGLTVAGSAAGGDTAGIGTSLAANVISNATEAFISEGAYVRASRAIDVSADASEELKSIAAGGEGGGDAGVAPSAVINTLTTLTQSYIASGASINRVTGIPTPVNPLQTVSVTAADHTDLVSVAGAAAYGGKAGIGAGVDVGVIDKTTQAFIASSLDDPTEVNAYHTVAVLAESSEDITSVSGGTAGSSKVGVAGAASVYTITNTTRGYIGDHALVLSGGNVLVSAVDDNEMRLIDGNVAFGGTAGIGASGAVAVIDKVTEAFIGAGADVTARGRTGAAEVGAGRYDVGYVQHVGGDGRIDRPNYQLTDITGDGVVDNEDLIESGSLTKDRVATLATTSIRGLVVTAAARDHVESVAAGGAGSISVGVSAGATVTKVANETRAYIADNATINQDNENPGEEQVVLVAAGTDFYHLGIAGSLSGAGQVGIGPGADITVVGNTTEAYVGSSSEVNARGDISIEAHSSEEILSIAAAAAGGGAAGVAGSVSVNYIDNRTYAWTGDDSQIDADGAVALISEDSTEIDVIDGSFGFGIGSGVGQSVGITVINKDTEAYVGAGSVIDARGDSEHDARGLLVRARSEEDVFNVVAGGGGGVWSGVAGAVTVNKISSRTAAFIGEGSRINPDADGASSAQSVSVSAVNDVEVKSISGSVGGAFVGVAGAVDIGVIQNDTAAYVGEDVLLNARRDVDVTATASRRLDNYALGHAGGAVGVTGGVSVWSVGSDVDLDIETPVGSLRSVLASSDGMSIEGVIDKQLYDRSAGYGLFGHPGVAAAGGVQELSMQASDEGGSSFGEMGFRSIADFLLGGLISDYETMGSTVTAVRDVIDQVMAALAAADLVGDDTSGVRGAAPLGHDQSMTMGVMSVGGMMSVAAGYSPRGTSAFIEDGAIINARDISLAAQEIVEFDQLAVGASIGAFATGAAVSVTTLQSATNVHAGSEAALNAGGAVTLHASLTQTHNVRTVAGNSSAFGDLGGSIIYVNDTGSSVARTGVDTEITSADDVRILAESVRTSSLLAEIAAVSGGTISGAVIWAKTSGITEAMTGPGAVISAGDDSDILVNANSTVTMTGVARGLSVAAALAVGVPYARLEDDSTTTAALGDSSRIDRAHGVEILAQYTPHVNSLATGVAVGGAAAQALLSRAVVKGSVESYLGDGTKVGTLSGLSVGSLDVIAVMNTPANSDNAAVAIAEGGAVGAISGHGADGAATVAPTIDAHIGPLAQVRTSSDIGVTARSLAGALAETRGLSLSTGFAVGVSLAEATLTPAIGSYVGESSVLDSAGSILVRATHNIDPRGMPLSNRRAEAIAWSATGSLGVSAGGSDAGTVSSATVESYVAGGAGSYIRAAGAVGITSSSNNQAKAIADGQAYGAIAGGAVLAEAIVSGVNRAYLNAATVQAGQLTVSSVTSDDSMAWTRSGAGGIVAGSGSIATSIADSETSAHTGSSVNATVFGAMLVTATARSISGAEARGVNASVSLAVGVSRALARNAPEVRAYLGQANTIISNTLGISATVAAALAGRESTRAYASGSTGGLAGFAATETEATNEASSESYIGDNSVLSVIGTVSVCSQALTKQTAYSTARTGGMLAAGSNTADAASATSIRAYTGRNVGITAGALQVLAAGTDDNFAESIAGTGGIVAGSAASARTLTEGETHAWVSGGTAGRRIDVGELSLVSDHTSLFNARTDTMTASVVGLSGSDAHNDVNHSVLADFLDAAVIRAGTLSVAAVNRITKDWLDGYNIRSGSGGLFDAPASASETYIRNSALVAVGEAVSIEVHGGSDGSGDLTMYAENDVVAHDQVGLDSGGAIAVARAETRIENTLNEARIIIGLDSSLSSSGDIDLSVSSNADLQAFVNGKTYGASGAAEGYSETRAFITNSVGIETGALLDADGDIRLQAGSDSSSHTSMALTYLWNKTAVPLDTSPVAKAYLSESNDIGISAGASVRSAGDVRLFTLSGGRNVYGYGKGKDYYREGMEYLANLLNDVVEFSEEEISLEIQYHSSTPIYSSGVDVDGIVEVGRDRRQFLIINEGGTVDSESSTEGITVSSSTEDLANSVAERLADVSAAIALLEWGGVTDDEVVLYNELLSERGQLVARLNELRDRTDVRILSVDQAMVARSGNIYIDSLSVSGSGSLLAPGDVEIRIENRSPNYFRTNAMTIPDATGGHIYFRDIRVTSADDINARNLGSGGWFHGDLTIGGSSTPVISIANTYCDDGGWGPDILVERSIANLNGIVEIRSDYGSVQIGKQADIVADTVMIAAGRNVYIGYSDGFTHIAGDVRERWAGLIDEYEGRGGEVMVLGSPEYLASQGDIDLGDLDKPSLIAGNKVFIGAEYLNINGIIQSGVPIRDLWIHEGNVEDQIQSAIADYQSKLAGGEDPDPLYRLSVDGSPVEKDDKGYVVSTGIEVFYNAAEDCLELTPVQTLGGYMELVGHIMNTGIGELRVLDGYSRINILNNTPYTLKLDSVSTGSGIEGMIRIIDTAKRTDYAHVSHFANTPLVTEIRRVGSEVQVSSNRVPNWYDPLVVTTPESTTLGRSTLYQPLENQYYSWTSLTTSTTVEEATEVWRIFGGVTHEFEYLGTQTSVTREDLAVDHLRILPGHDEAYWYQGSIKTTAGEWEEVTPYELVYEGPLDIAYERQVRRETVQSGIHHHNIYASNTIDINFVGFDEGQLRVVSPGIIVDGLIENRSGSVWMSTSGSILQSDNVAAGIRGGSIELYAEGNVGSTLNPLITDLLGGGLTARSAGGDVYINEIAGDLICDSVLGGEVYLVADQNISTGIGGRISGGHVTLLSEHGGIGTDQSRARVNVGPEGLTAQAVASIYIEVDRGDLTIDSVVSLDGDVDLVALEGDIIDVNPNRERDEVAESEILEFWERIRLTGADAERSADDTVAAYENQKLSEYRTYWQHRERFKDKDGKTLPYSPTSVIVLSKSESSYLETELGWSERMIGEYEARLTAEYHELHSSYGSESKWFDPNWRYAVARPVDSHGIVYDPSLYDTVKYSDWHSLTSGHSWTLAELQNGIDKSLMSKELTDTNVWIEEPNVVGRNVILTAPNGSIGHDQEIIIPVDRVGYGKPRLGDLTAEQIVMLLTAEKKDVSFWKDFSIKITSRETVDVDASAMVTAGAQGFVYLASETDINLHSVTAGGDVRIKANGAIGSARFDGMANITGGDTFLEAGHSSIGQLRTLIIDIGSSLLTARGYNIDIRSLGDLTVDEIYGRDSVRVTSSGSIAGSSITYPVLGWRGHNFRTADLTLSARGSIGSPAAPLTIGLDPTGMLNASADVDIHIASPDNSLTTGYVGAATGTVSIACGEDLHIRSSRGSYDPTVFDPTYGIYALNGRVEIEAAGSILDADADQYLSIAACQIDLWAQGSIGAADNELELQTDQWPGGLQPRLNAHGSDGVFMSGILGDVRVGEITSSGDVRLSATNGALILGRINAGSGIVTLTADTYIANSLSRDVNNVVADSIDVVARGGGVGSLLKPLRIDTQTSSKNAIGVSAGGDIYLVESAGDMVLSEIHTSGDTIVLLSYGGMINGNADGTPNIIVGGTNGEILLTAAGDIGELDKPLEYAAAGGVPLMGMSGGSMYVRSVSGILADSIVAGGRVFLEAAKGDIQRTQTGSITADWVDLVAREGAIGTHGRYILIDAASRMNALAHSDIFIEVHGGDLRSDYIVSLAGKVHLYVPGGNALIGRSKFRTYSDVKSGLRSFAGSGLGARSLADPDLEDLSGVSATELLCLLSSPGTLLSVDQLQIEHGVQVNADAIELDDLAHTGTAPLQMHIGGGSTQMSGTFTATIRSSTGVAFESLNSDVSLISMNTDFLEFTNAVIGTRALIDTESARLLVGRAGQSADGCDIVLVADTAPVDLVMTGERDIRTNAKAAFVSLGFTVNGVNSRLVELISGLFWVTSDPGRHDSDGSYRRRSDDFELTFDPTDVLNCGDLEDEDSESEEDQEREEEDDDTGEDAEVGGVA